MAVSGGGPTSPGYSPRPQIRFDVIGEAWRLFQQQMGTWIVAVLVVVVCYVAVAIVFGVLGAGMSIGAGQLGPRGAAGAAAFQGTAGALRMLQSAINLIIQYFFMGGLVRMALRQIRGEPIAVGDIFTVTDVIGPLAVAAILVTLAQYVAICALCIGFFIVGGLLMFTVPLVVDRRMSAVEAMGESWNALKGDIIMATLFFFVVQIVFPIVGACACCIGYLFLFPLVPLSTALLYRDFFLGGMQPASPYAPPPPPGYAPPPPPTMGYTPPAYPPQATDLTGGQPQTAPPPPAQTDIPPLPESMPPPPPPPTESAPPPPPPPQAPPAQ